MITEKFFLFNNKHSVNGFVSHVVLTSRVLHSHIIISGIKWL